MKSYFFPSIRSGNPLAERFEAEDLKQRCAALPRFETSLVRGVCLRLKSQELIVLVGYCKDHWRGVFAARDCTSLVTGSDAGCDAGLRVTPAGLNMLSVCVDEVCNVFVRCQDLVLVEDAELPFKVDFEAIRRDEDGVVVRRGMRHGHIQQLSVWRLPDSVMHRLQEQVPDLFKEPSNNAAAAAFIDSCLNVPVAVSGRSPIGDRSDAYGAAFAANLARELAKAGMLQTSRARANKVCHSVKGISDGAMVAAGIPLATVP